MKEGLFITIEGVEGAGKSTAISFMESYFKEKNIEVVVTREPGGTNIAEQIRGILLSHHDEDMHYCTELLLYFASRAQHFNQLIVPSLKKGKWVICDRFTDATYAYQGAGRRLPMDEIAILENLVQGDKRPDITLFFDVDVEVGFDRINKNRSLDRLEIEDMAFYKRVRDCYLARAQKEKDRFKIIDANLSLEKIELQIKRILDLAV